MSQDLETVVINVLSHPTQEGNRFLIDFVDTEAAWEASMTLFQSTHDYVQYFAANMIYTKIRKHWSQLNSSQRTELYEFLMRYMTIESEIESTGNRKAFLDRVILALACVCARAPGGFAIYLKRAFEMFGNFQSAKDLVGLNMLTALPTEVDDLDISRSLRLELQAQFLQIMPEITRLVDSIGSAPSSPRVQVASIRLLRAWIMHGITLASLFEDHQATVGLIFSALRSGNGELVKDACSFLREVFCIKDFPRSAAHDRAVQTVVHTFTAQAGSLAPFFGADGDEDVVHEVCNALVSLSTNEISVIVSPQGCSTDFFVLLLSCVSQRPRKIATLTFDVWASLQDIPVVERHPYLSQEVFYKLLDILCGQVMYPAGFTSWSTCDDDEDDFEQFRDHKYGIKEVLLGCCYALQSAFFALMGEKLGIFAQSSKWQVLEGVLYVLQASIDAIKSSCRIPDQKDAIVQFLCSVVQLSLANGTDTSPPMLREAISKFLGSVTFLLVGDATAKQFFPGVVQFVYRASLQPETSNSASKSLHSLCIHGSALMATPVVLPSGEQQAPMVVGIIEAAAKDFLCLPAGPVADAAPNLLLIEGIARIVVQLPVEAAREQLYKMGRPITERLALELAQAAPNEAAVRILLQYAGQVVRFCDVFEDDGEHHPLVPFLSEFWPQLQALEGISGLVSVPGVVEKLFEFYSRVLQSASFVMLPQLPRTAEIIAVLFEMKNEGCTAALGCAITIIEVLSRKERAENHQFLSSLLVRLTGILAAAIAQTIGVGRELGYEPDSVEKYFQIVHELLLFFPLVVSQSPCLPQVISSCLSCLSTCKERGPVRMLLQVLQFLFQPAQRRVEDPRIFLHLLHTCCEVGGALVMSLFTALNGGLPSMVWPNIIDTLLSIICGCEEVGRGADVRAWVSGAITSPDILKALSMDDRRSVFEAIFHHAINNKRRYKALLQDIAKICGGEQTVDALLATHPN